MAIALQLRGMEKTYGATRALRGVDFDVRRGEVHALLGQNGSGKSTLMKIAYGEVQADAGEILVAGEPRRFKLPQDALAAGIGAVAQEVPLVPALSVAENISLGRLRRRGLSLDRRSIQDVARQTLARLGSDVDVRRPVASLAPFERQLVAIARALSTRTEVLILDEPTSSLSVEHARDLFGVLDGLRQQGVAMVLITQKLKEVGEVADRVTILRDGAKVGEYTESLDRLPIDELVGAVQPPDQVRTSVITDREPVLTVSDLRAPGLDGITLHVNAGEIVGLAGLAGCGRPELLRTLFGGARTDGTMTLDGSAYAPRSPGGAITRKVAFVTGDRRGEGLNLDQSVRENLMTVRRRRSGLRPINHSRERALAAEMVDRLRIKTGSTDAPVRTLSGGNQQRSSSQSGYSALRGCFCSTSRPAESTSRRNKTFIASSKNLPTQASEW
jgi:ABC-type sugar transport system ATPase subunit